MSGRKYKRLKVNAGGWCDWQSPLHGHGDHNYRMRCCDCALIHEMQFRIVDKSVIFRVRRNNRATAASRRCGKT